MAPAWLWLLLLPRIGSNRSALAFSETGGTVLAAAMPGKIKTFTQMFAIIFY